MSWKVTAAASGLMVVATWLASHAPVGGPREASIAPSAAHTETAAAAIQREASRLHDRLQLVAAYKVPSRNPFRFGTRPAQAVAPRQQAMPVEQVAPPVVEPQPPTFRMMLSGIGEDVEGEQVTRTAIISTPDNVHLVKVGETLGVYQVTDIAADSVTLTRLEDGSAVQLTLRR